jgi:hypothetical protein
MVLTEEKTRFHHIASLNAWAIASHFNCEFDGDSNPINHGGFFYNPRTWDTDGYVNAVEFYQCPRDDRPTNDKHLIVQLGTIRKPKDNEGWESCWSCIGIAADDPDRKLPRAQVWACRAGRGINPKGITYPYVKEFNLRRWAEWRIWMNISDWLIELGK